MSILTEPIIPHYLSKTRGIPCLRQSFEHSRAKWLSTFPAITRLYPSVKLLSNPVLVFLSNSSDQLPVTSSGFSSWSNSYITLALGYPMASLVKKKFYPRSLLVIIWSSTMWKWPIYGSIRFFNVSLHAPSAPMQRILEWQRIFCPCAPQRRIYLSYLLSEAIFYYAT